jgi:Glutathione-dependent formaldehyde-activating enzyme
MIDHKRSTSNGGLPMQARHPSGSTRGRCRDDQGRLPLWRGGVRFEIDEARLLTYCHCSNCRKLSGAHVASYVHVDAEKFRLVAGEDLIQTFQSAPGSFRNFCRVCSSTVPGKAISHDGKRSCGTSRR